MTVINKNNYFNNEKKSNYLYKYALSRKKIKNNSNMSELLNLEENLPSETMLRQFKYSKPWIKIIENNAKNPFSKERKLFVHVITSDINQENVKSIKEGILSHWENPKEVVESGLSLGECRFEQNLFIERRVLVKNNIAIQDNLMSLGHVLDHGLLELSKYDTVSAVVSSFSEVADIAETISNISNKKIDVLRIQGHANVQAMQFSKNSIISVKDLISNQNCLVIKKINHSMTRNGIIELESCNMGKQTGNLSDKNFAETLSGQFPGKTIIAYKGALATGRRQIISCNPYRTSAINAKAKGEIAVCYQQPALSDE